MPKNTLRSVKITFDRKDRCIDEYGVWVWWYRTSSRFAIQQADSDNHVDPDRMIGIPRNLRVLKALIKELQWHVTDLEADQLTKGTLDGDTTDAGGT